ncbi:DEAD/DEAH box helicase [Desulfurococcus amylolyticus]|uniref:DEAD/DEAH box helicase n=1 Tax=Desulfurococcus amylolyticus TaxID=94694 RepID=UPI0023F574E1|nr:DEAD/DEAH box helicase [Desulfurococcus amylolyticus]
MGLVFRDPLVNEVDEELRSRYPESGVAVIYERVEETREPEPGPSIEELDLPGEVARILHRRGIRRLYRFQYEAYRHILNRENTVISAGTGTGKTEAFLLPILREIYYVRKSNPRAMILYPTKALARDQLNRFTDYTVYPIIGFSIYDGDTPRRQREKIGLNPPSLIISNPDMLHIGLVYSSYIRGFVENSEFMVFDELHVYEGVLGSHIHHLVERIKRTSREKPVFIGSSATIGNPKEFAEELFGEEVVEVRGEAFRKGMVTHVLVSSGYLSRWSVVAYLCYILSRRGLKYIVFVDSQQLAELLTRILKTRYNVNIMVHRAGLPADVRRDIEVKLRNGLIDGVVATSTLELGIDIGALDATVMAMPPPSYSKYLQRAGRAGRRRKGYVFTVLGDDPIDVYYARSPERFFTQSIPPSVIEPSNEEVAKTHLVAYLLQSWRARIDSIPGEWRNIIDELVAEGIVKKTGEYIRPIPVSARRLLSTQGGLRGMGPIVEIVDSSSGDTLATRELPVALLELYPGAIYLYMGEPYIVESLNLVEKKALVKTPGENITVYTRPLYTVDVVNYDVLMERKSSRGIMASYAKVVLELSVNGVVVKDMYTGETRFTMDLEKPIKYQYSTRALLLKYPAYEELGIKGCAEAFHAIEHALISAARVTCGSGLTDLGGISYPSGDIVIYDSAIGGSGLSKLLYKRLEETEDVALEIMGKCDCYDGCPRCIYSPYCGNNNQILSRRKAIYVLSKIREGKAQAVAHPLELRGGKPLV